MSNPFFVNELVRGSDRAQPARCERSASAFALLDLRRLDRAQCVRRHLRQRAAAPNPLIAELQRRVNATAHRSHHLLGTDDLGRDIFSRIVFGSRVSIEVSLGSMLIGFGIGAPLGMLAAYRRGKFDTILSTVMYVFLAFPAIIATIAVLSFWTPRSLLKIIVVVGVAAIPLVYRVIRGRHLMNLRRRGTLSSPRKSRAPQTGGILMKELLPNVAPVGVSFLLIGIATVVTLEGALAFLGLSVTPPTPSWGNMINESLANLQVNPWLAIFPSAAMCLFSALSSINFIGW